MDRTKKRVMYFMYYFAWTLGFIAIGFLVYGIVKELVG